MGPARPRTLGELRDGWELRRDRRLPLPAGVEPRDFGDVEQDLAAALGGRLDDTGFADLEAELRDRLENDPARAAYPLAFNASLALARACWRACTLTNAQLVVETGVAAGLTTSFILGALEQTGGQLHSIDFPPRTVKPGQVGWLVPARLRDRWTLHRGRSRTLLPKVLKSAGRPDVFIHDGLHTLPTMRFELALAARHIKRPGVILCDDAERHPAFADWALERNPPLWSLVQTEYAGHHFGLGAFF